jgi:uncharacterized ion transporter superfamily protein YfcC
MKLKVPHTLVLLFGMMVFALLLTYILPQGSFQMSENQPGREVVVPGSYEQLPQNSWLSPLSLFTVLPRAFADSQAIIFFVFIIGGALSVIKSTGVIDAILGKMLEKFSSKPNILIVATMLVFSVGSSTLGMAEEFLPFVTILIALSVGLGMDALTGVGIMVVGYGIGYGVAAINPFTLLLAQDVAGLQPVSGLWYRLVLFVPFFLIGWHHVQKYALMVKNSPERSLILNEPSGNFTVSKDYPNLTKTHYLLFVIIIATLG